MAPSRRNVVLAPAQLQDALGRLERLQDLHERLTSVHDETDADDS
ncbi:hypothetical protein ACWEQ3_29790 [Streptomyces mirabilis]